MFPDYPNNIVIRVGECQSPYKENSHWYLEYKEDVIQYTLNTNRNIK